MTDPISELPQPGADEALLEQLAEALRPPPLTPPPASVAALRREVEQKWRPTAWTRMYWRLVAWARRLQRAGAAVAVLGGVAAGGPGIALAAGGSTPQTVHHTLPDPGIPLLLPAAQHGGDPRLAFPSVKVAPRSVPQPVPMRSRRRGIKPLVPAAASQARIFPASRGGSPGDTIALRPWSAGPVPPTGGIPTYSSCGANRCTSQPAPGTAYPATPGRTSPTAWSGATTSGTGRTGSGWSQTGPGGATTITASGWDRLSGDAAYAPTTRRR
jgi:hypothetical protein